MGQELPWRVSARVTAPLTRALAYCHYSAMADLVFDYACGALINRPCRRTRNYTTRWGTALAPRQKMDS